MSNSNTGDLNLIFNGLMNFAVTMTVAGDYVVQVQNSLPLAREGTPSSLQTQIKLNSTTKLTSEAGASGARVIIQGVAVGDVIHIITTSSAAADNALNAIKSQVQIFMGDI